MNKKTQKNNLIMFCISFIAIFTVFTFNGSNSRYVGKIVADEEVLAVPVLTLSNNSQSYVATNMLPGETKEYKFSVSNVDGESTNEVLLEYYFKVTTETTVPIEVKLYEITGNEEREIQIANNESETIRLNVVNQSSDKITKNYTLKFIWDIDFNSYEYAQKEISCSVVLEAIQVVT